jgi:hypothetical protein
MQRLVDTLQDGSSSIESIQRDVNAIRASIVEMDLNQNSDDVNLGNIDVLYWINHLIAKTLWNTAVTTALNSPDMEPDQLNMLASCRELAFLAMQKFTWAPLDEQSKLHNAYCIHAALFRDSSILGDGVPSC